MPSNWLVWDRIREFARSNRIYQQERILQDQSSVDRLAVGGDFLDFSSQNAILQQTNLQINRLERYKDYEQMDQTGEITLALDLFSDECLCGDTCIPLLDGTRPTIRELASFGPDHKFWVFAQDQDGKLVPAEAYNARMTRRNAEMVKVLLDDGAVVRVTPDHLFKLRDGSYQEARLLKSGDRLMPLYLKTNYRRKKGKYLEIKPYPTATAYDFIYTGDRFQSVHRWVYESLHEDHPEIVHHNNIKSRDNTPRNLIGMTWLEHQQIHRKLGPDNPSFNKLTLADIDFKLAGWRGSLKRKDILRLLGVGFRVLDRLLAGADLTWEDFKSKYHVCECGTKLIGTRKVCNKCKVIYQHDWHQQHKDNHTYRLRRLLAKRADYQAVQWKVCQYCEEKLPIEQFKKSKCSVSPYCNECRPGIVQKRYLKKCFNHKVVSVIPDGVEAEVFDITVPGHNCFAAGTESSWVIVHNCSLIDPEHKHGIIIRAANRRIKEDLEELYYDTLLIDRWLRPASRYLCKFGDSAFEIVTDRNRTGVSSLRFMNIYNFTRIETRFGDLVGFFYQDEMYPEPVFLHPWACMHSRLTNFENIYAPYGRCAALSSPILTPQGYKELGDIDIGNTVYSFNGLTKQETKVLGMIHSGMKSGIRIRTKYRELEVSEDHPILAVLRGAGGKLFRRYVPAKHVVSGSMVVVHDPEIDDDNSYMVEEVTKQSEIGQIEVGDIQVDSGHGNFIANGIAIHNSVIDGSRKPFKQLRLMEDASLIYRICLRGDSLIWTPTGHKQIKDLRVGDKVYCFKEGKLQETHLIDTMCNGNDVVYHIKSQHREIYANATHPVLVEVSYANKCKYDRPIRLEYIDVKDLVVKRNSRGSHHRFVLPEVKHAQYVNLTKIEVPLYAQSEAGIWRPALAGQNGARSGWVFDYSFNICEEFTLPDVADEDFARWFGFMVGDGYVSRRRSRKTKCIVSEVGITLGDDIEINGKYVALFEKYVGKTHFSEELRSEAVGKAYVYSRYLVKFMIANGFVPGAHNKRIPEWVFRSPRSVQEAFIDGLVDADGHRRIFKGGITESCEIELCNEMLVRDLKELCHRLGWNAGSVRTRYREHTEEIVPGRMLPTTESWELYFTKQRHESHDFVPAGALNSGRSEAILSVEEDGEDLVYDVTIADDIHNIIVNGVVTHQTRGPEKRKYKIPVGMIPPKEIPEYLMNIARLFKRQRFYNPTTGTFDERYSPIVQEDDFFLPMRPDGTGPDIEVLPGGENMDKISDIEYFKKKMIAPLKIPFARVGIGEGAGEPNEKSLAQSDAEFAKAVQWIQSEIALSLQKVGIVHLALRGHSVQDIKGFSLSLASTSALDDLYRMETWATRVNVMSDLKEIGWFPREWIVTRFTDLSPDEIQEMEEMSEAESEGKEEGGGGGGGGGGLGDMGGDEMGGDEMGGEEMGGEEMGGDELDFGDEGGGDEGGGELEPEEEEEAFELEHRKDEKRMITEIRRDKRRTKKYDNLVKLSSRTGRPSNPFQFLLESKELDGLSKTPPEMLIEGVQDKGILVGVSIQEEVRQGAMNEIKNIIKNQQPPTANDTDVNSEDLPEIP